MQDNMRNLAKYVLKYAANMQHIFGITKIKYKKLTSLHYCVRATKSHIQNYFTRTQSDRTTKCLPLQTHVT